MEKANRASLEFSLQWQSQYAHHNDRFFSDRTDFWRDFFPGKMADSLSTLQPGESYSESFGTGVLVPQFQQNNIARFREKLFESNRGETVITPMAGRFYPQGFAWSPLGCFPENFLPFRIIKVDNEMLVGDKNHPLATYPLDLTATFVETLKPAEERGGACSDIGEMVTINGPGMQSPHPDNPSDFYSEYPFNRENNENDTDFYEKARLVNHLDDMAISQVKSIYGELLPAGCKVLDLMSSWTSHLPDSLTNYEATGLGMNEEELKQNNALSDYIVQDLNRNTLLPFLDNCYDAVICTASIEYLTQPLEVLSEIARITKPGGVFVTTFSDRWFPGKEISLWSEMHPFERQGLILDYYIKTGSFEDLHTESVRGLLRPYDDKYINETYISDPIFAVWGRVRG